jgi:hypothetical protein
VGNVREAGGHPPHRLPAVARDRSYAGNAVDLDEILDLCPQGITGQPIHRERRWRGDYSDQRCGEQSDTALQPHDRSPS